MTLVWGHTAEVIVGPFRIADLTAASVTQHVIDLALVKGAETPVTCYALHVQGLNRRRNARYVAAMNSADLVYADGGSVVLLAKLAGATSIQRAPTTDIAWDVLDGIRARTGTVPRVALVGGEPGLADRAATAIRQRGAGDPVVVEHGYQRDWSAVVQRLADAEPTVVLLGLGTPQEMIRGQQMKAQLKSGLILTCGGWFGFVAGEEIRAPMLLRKPGVEWIARVAQSPTRLAPRYARGIASTASLAPAAVRARRPARAHDGE